MKNTNHSILTACIFAFIFIFAILIVQSCSNGQQLPNDSVDTVNVHSDSLQFDTER